MKAKNNYIKDNIIENITAIIKNSDEMLIVGFVDKTELIDKIISHRLKAILESLENKIKILEYDAELIINSCNFFNVVTIPTYNIYYQNVLLEQFDLMDTSFEMKKKLSSLIIN